MASQMFIDQTNPFVLSFFFSRYLGCVDDVYIVPVSISYEKLVDGSFIDEQMGIPKKFENFSATSKAIWSTLHSNFGIVRVDFSKPFLLKEFLYQSIQRETECFDIPKELTLQARKDFNAIRDCIACEGNSVIIVFNV